jgi:hypothetical protein
MKTFEISVKVIGYRDVTIEAESEGEALGLARDLVRLECNNLDHLVDVQIRDVEIICEYEHE